MKSMFAYECLGTYGVYGHDDGGFSVEITPDGRIIYKSYLLGEILKSEDEYQLSESSVQMIKSTLSEYKDQISSFKKEYYNGSCDGSWNKFSFSGKKITTLNAFYMDEIEIEHLKSQDEAYFYEMSDVIEAENKLIEIFEAISKILLQDGYSLQLHGFRVE